MSQRNQTEQRNNTYMLQCIGEVRKGDSIIIGESSISCIFCHFCRTHLAVSDISCIFLSFLSDISGSVGHILRFVVIFVGHI